MIGRAIAMQTYWTFLLTMAMLANPKCGLCGGDSSQRAGSRAKALAVPSHADVVYGPHARNRLDLWLARSETPTPLLVCIHGGGFAAGDKSAYAEKRSLIKRMHGEGISVAALNYRLTEGGKHPYPAPMLDCARAVQFLRLHAGTYNLDKSRIAATGGSAGGTITLWLAFHDDLADPKADDPVLRESTRLLAAAPSGAQTSVHLPTLLEWFGVESLQEHRGGRPLFGLPSDGELKWTDQLDRQSRDASPITHLTADVPPVYYTAKTYKPIRNNMPSGAWVHHPLLGIKLKQAMDKLGLKCFVSYEGADPIGEYENQMDFVIQQLKAARR